MVSVAAGTRASVESRLLRIEYYLSDPRRARISKRHSQMAGDAIGMRLLVELPAEMPISHTSAIALHCGEGQMLHLMLQWRNIRRNIIGRQDYAAY